MEPQRGESLGAVRPIPVATFGILTALLLSACTIERADVRTPSGESPEADTTRVRQTIEAIGTAFETGRVAELDSIFHDSVLVFEFGRVERGWVAYRDGHLLPETRALSDRSLEFRTIDVHIVRSTAWATVRYTLSGRSESGRVGVEGLGTLILRRLAGRWQLVHVHLSSRPPASNSRQE